MPGATRFLKFHGFMVNTSAYVCKIGFLVMYLDGRMALLASLELLWITVGLLLHAAAAVGAPLVCRTCITI